MSLIYFIMASVLVYKLKKMSNENMANQLTDVPSAIAELLALNKQLKQQLEEKDEEIKQLKKEGMVALSKLKEAVEVIEFYGNDDGSLCEKDSEYLPSGFFKYRIGKCARQFLAKYHFVNANEMVTKIKKDKTEEGNK